jgi:2TM domain
MTRITEWALGIVGAIAAFMGLVVLFAGENQYIGFGGGLTWRVGDIQPAWGYGLLAGGVVLLMGAAALVVWERRHPQAYREQSERAALVTHIIVFVLVNAFLWFQDIVADGGLNYAYLVTIPWGIGLAAHIVAYFSDRRHPSLPTPA